MRSLKEKNTVKIGDLIIDFKIIIGDLDKSIYKSDQLIINWVDEIFRPIEPVASIIQKQWEKYINQAKKRGQFLSDEKLARLVNLSEISGEIFITLQPTSYRIFCTTNLNLDSLIIPRSDEVGNISIRELAGPEIYSTQSPYLANPLNVIAMIITKDDFIFTPIRSQYVFESPNTLQASVGGAIQPKEHPTSALIREIKEEWGLDINESEIEFLTLGINKKTCEPDLLAKVELDIDNNQVNTIFKIHCQKDEFNKFKSYKLNQKNLNFLLSILRLKKWSQPSDQAAFLLVLIRKLGFKIVENSCKNII